MSKHEKRFWSSWIFLGQSDFKQGLLGVSDGKNLPAMQETCILSLGWEDPLEEGMTTHSSILAWRVLMDRGVCLATVHRVTKNWMRLSAA